MEVGRSENLGRSPRLREPSQPVEELDRDSVRAETSRTRDRVELGVGGSGFRQTRDASGTQIGAGKRTQATAERI